MTHPSGINRTKSRKAIETLARANPSSEDVRHVSTEPKAERQLRHPADDLLQDIPSGSINRTKSRKAIETARPSVLGQSAPAGVSTEPKAERQLRRGGLLVLIGSCGGRINRTKSRKAIETSSSTLFIRVLARSINRTKSRKAIETLAQAGVVGPTLLGYQPNQKPKGN